jgi:hypothetical protein
MVSPSISVTSSPPGWPVARRAWWRYGRPIAITLPLPPQPTTVTRMVSRWSR